MFKLGPSSNTVRVSVIFDIGSAGIGVGVVVRESSSNSTKLVWHNRIAYGYQSVDDFDRYTHTMYATVLEAGMKAKNEGVQNVKKKHPHIRLEEMDVYCVLNAPWYFGAVQTKKKHGSKPFQITEKALSALTHDAHTKVLDSRQCKQWQEIMGKGEQLEAFIDSVSVNGYPVSATVKNHFAKDVSIQTYISITPCEVHEHVSEILTKLFPNHNVQHVSSAQLFSGTPIKGCVPIEQKRTIFVEVGGEMTSLYLVTQGAVYSISTFSHGTNHILREVAPQALSAKEAKDAIGLTLKKVGKIHTKEDVPEALRPPLAQWKEEFSRALEVVAGGITPPAHIVVLTNTFWQTLYTAVLNDTFTMPGVRKDVMLHVCPFSKGILSKRENVKQNKTTDTRLLSIAHSLSNYTHKKSMCYTNK